MWRIVHFWCYLVAASTLLSCAPRLNPGPPAARNLPDRDLLEALRARVDTASAERTQAGMRGLKFVPDSVDFLEESSRAVPGLAYRWAIYQPPRTFDLLFTVLGGRLGGASRVLDNPRDWWGLVLTSAWKPATAEDALRACRELVEYVGPRRDAAIRPVPYEGAGTLTRMFAVDRDSILRFGVTPPRLLAGRPDSGWTVSLWALEAGQTTHYKCNLGPEDQSNLIVTDSILGVGLQPRGP